MAARNAPSDQAATYREEGVSYELLDSGDGRKLERVAGVLMDRQAPQAAWRRRRKRLWSEVDGRHVRSEAGGGHWEWRRDPPRRWTVATAGLTMLLKATPFGHLGLFPEQRDQWSWLAEQTRSLAARLTREPNVLNLFAYTGGSTLTAATAGASVTHVDAARGVVDWAKENASINELVRAPIRWIVDDCARFANRELRRGRRYEGVILDPPTFGRGTRGEVWKIEEDLRPLLRTLAKLLAPSGFLLLSAHTPGFTPTVLENVARDFFEIVGGEGGEMVVPHAEDDRLLPSGAFFRATVA